MAELLGAQQDHIIKVRDHEAADFEHDGEVIKLKGKVIENSDGTLSLVDSAGVALSTWDVEGPLFATEGVILSNDDSDGYFGTSDGVLGASLVNTSGLPIEVKIQVSAPEVQTDIKENGNAGVNVQYQINAGAWVSNPVGINPWVTNSNVLDSFELLRTELDSNVITDFESVAAGGTITVKVRAQTSVTGATNNVNYAFLEATIERVS